jgi:shikimate dehydrogenase
MICHRSQHLYLAGFMGTGKSAAGRLVARRLDLPFIDLDAVIAARTSRTITAIFAEEGEPVFRQYEAEALESVVKSVPSVIALGGGAPTVAAVREIVKETGIAFLLTADWQTIWNRIRGDTSRPLLARVLDEDDADTGDPFERFVARATPILEARVIDYDTLADYTIDTSALSPDDVAERILAIVKGTSAKKGE